MNILPIKLSGAHVDLDPLERSHFDELYEVGLDPSIWSLTVNVVNCKDDLKRYLEKALSEKDRGISLPFVTREKASGRAVGSTRFGNFDLAHKRVEIGWTWINPKWQRTVVNTEAKLLMLTHAFEEWSCIRVELKTDVLNERSRSAILRIGAKEEGTFRQHMVTESGRLRDSVYFSIIDSEWRQVKKALAEKLQVSN